MTDPAAPGTPAAQTAVSIAAGTGASLEATPSEAAMICLRAGSAAREARDPARAEALYRRACQLTPELALAWHCLGLALGDQQRLTEAEAAYRRAIVLDPAFSGSWDNLGNLLQELRRHAEAERCYREALRLNPNAFSAYNNLGALLSNMDRHADAEAAYRGALGCREDCAEAHHNLGLALYNQHRVGAATAAFRRAYALRPDLVQALCKIPHMKRAMCAWQGLAEDDAEVLRCIGRGQPGDFTPFVVLAMPAATPAHLRDATRLRAAHSYRNALAREPLVVAGSDPDAASPAGDGRMRIGYLSADFQEHATTHLLAGVIEAHDAKRFDVHLYSYGASPDDAYRQRLRLSGARFTDLARLDDESAARRIADDRLHLLVDLKGFTRNSRLGITARRPAPILVNWLGYPGSLGHPRLADYLIGDAVVSPLSHASHYSETLALMPHCYQPNDRQRAIGPTPSRSRAGLPESGFIFASLNQSYKIEPGMFSLWCRLLQALPGSVLWLLDPKSAEACANLRREAAARGVDPARLLFAPRLGQTEHLGRLRLADLALDTFPVTSHTTGSDALWAGVPLVTRMGSTFASRVAASLLHAVGLPELVTRDETAYFALALDLARNPARLAELRARLHQLRLHSPLFDTRRFTRHLETLFLSMRAQSLAGRRNPIILRDIR